MLVVVLDSATPAITAAVVSIDPAASSDPRGRTPDRTSPCSPNASTSTGEPTGSCWRPEIASVLAEVGKVAADLGAVIAGVGPGPFTGLRVGLVTAAALADTLGIPAYGVGTLDAIGAAAGPGTVLVATDARRREVYWAVYRDGVRMTEPSVDRPADVVSSPEFQAAGVEAAVGAGAQLYATVIGLPIRDEPHLPARGRARLARCRPRPRRRAE